MRIHARAADKVFMTNRMRADIKPLSLLLDLLGAQLACAALDAGHIR